MKLNLQKITVVGVIVSVYIIHYLWIFSTVLWTSKPIFFMSFHVILLVFLFMLFYKRQPKLITCIVLGVLMGVFVNYLGALVSNLITRPDVVKRMINSLWPLDLDNLVTNFIFFPTVTGNWIVSLIFTLSLYKNNCFNKQRCR